VIFNGFKLIAAPARAWSSGAISGPCSAGGLVAAALTAAIWPAIAVVGGQLGSAALGFATPQIAVQRAAVGFVAAVGGALVAAPALALAMMRVCESSRAPDDLWHAGRIALGLVWPAWAAGLLLAVPPLVGLGPELGEIAWFAAGLAVAVRALGAYSRDGNEVRRRWAGPFFVRAALVFAFLFAAVPIAPAIAVRAALGVQGELIGAARVEPVSWPLPETPDW
jgi:hypothetical protein